MAGQAEAGDIRQRMHAVQRGQIGAGGVELRGAGDHLRVAVGAERVLFERGRHHAHPQWLAQHQQVAHPGIGVALNPFRVHQAHRHQPVDRFDRVDGVAAGNRNARLAADRGATLQDLSDRCQRQHVDRHAHQRQRHDRPAAHGVHVADGVGGGDAPEVERVVDDGHEEVGGGDQRLLVVEAVDGGVVAGLDAHQQFRGDRHLRRALEDVRQHAGRDLATAAATVRERGEPGFGGGGSLGHSRSFVQGGLG